jgi:hypothetical protein
MRSSMAYFAGAGTVITAIAMGLGGGYLFFSIVSPHPEKHGSSEVARLERRAPEPIQATTGASVPVPYLAAPQVSAAVAEPTPQPAPQAQTPAPQPQQQVQQASTQPAAAATSPPTSSPPAAQPVAAVEQPAAREKAAPEESFAKARDTDVKRDARRAEDKRKAERRQQWTERRKWRQRDDGDGELRDVERRVREDTEPRRVREDSEPRPLFASEPARLETRRIKLFGNDD